MKNIEIYKFLSPDRIIDLKSSTKKGALEELIDVISQSPKISDKEKFAKKIFEREKLMSTGLGYGIAIPHIRDNSIKDFVMALGRKKQGLDYDAIDKKPVRLIFMIGGNDSQKDEYIKLLSELTKKLKNKDFKNRILEARDADHIYKIIKENY